MWRCQVGTLIQTLEFRGEVKVGHAHLGVISLWMHLKSWDWMRSPKVQNRGSRTRFWGALELRGHIGEVLGITLWVKKYDMTNTAQFLSKRVFCIFTEPILC